MDTTTLTHQDLFDEALARGVKDQLFPGGAIGSYSNGVITTSYSDTLIPGSTKKFSAGTLFDIASLIKCILGIVTMKCIERGLITLDTPIRGFVGGVGKDWDKITFRHLLTNSLEFDFKDDLWKLNPEQVEMIITSANVTGLGNSYYYHNSNSILLGWALEVLLNETLCTIIQREVLTPAGMSDTFFWGSLPKDRLVDVPPSLNLRMSPEPFVGIPHDGIAYMFARHHQDVGCAGIFSTLPDMLSFGRYVIKGAFKNPSEMHRMMLVNYLEHCGRTACLGFDRHYPDYLSEEFSNETLVMTAYTGCYIAIRPERDDVLVILSNVTYPAPTAEREIISTGPVSPLVGFRKSLATQVFITT